MMRHPGAIVYDFEGTWTDSQKEMEPVVEACKDWLVRGIPLNERDFNDIFEPAMVAVRRDHEKHGIRSHPDPNIITAPFSADLFELYAKVFAEVLYYFAYDNDVPPETRANCKRFASDYAPSVCRQGYDMDMLVAAHSILCLKHNEMNEGGTTTSFRPGLEEHLEFVFSQGFEISVISNMHPAAINRQIATREKLARLVQEMKEHGMQIVGSAKKNRVDPRWSGAMYFDQPKGFKGVPEHVHMTKHGLYRQVFMRRKFFAQALEGIGFVSQFPRFAVGGTVEGHLLLPHILWANAILLNHDFVPSHEIMWAVVEKGAGLAHSFEDVSEMLSSGYFDSNVQQPEKQLDFDGGRM